VSFVKTSFSGKEAKVFATMQLIISCLIDPPNFRGIRCRHCSQIRRASGRLAKGSVYYSRTLDGLYQVRMAFAIFAERADWDSTRGCLYWVHMYNRHHSLSCAFSHHLPGVSKFIKSPPAGHLSDHRSFHQGKASGIATN
jgi:hypothetical protein